MSKNILQCIEINNLFKIESTNKKYCAFYLFLFITSINACILICLKYRKRIEESNFIVHTLLNLFGII